LIAEPPKDGILAAEAELVNANCFC